MKCRMTSVALDQGVGVLADLPRSELVERWQTLCGADPPKGISRLLLVRAIAYEMQARRYGGLRPATSRRLLKLVHGSADAESVKNITAPKLKPGARLVCEWNGSVHVVEVVEGGIVSRGKRHSSLSAIARAITGARWSGPRLFGLTLGGAS